MNKNILNFLLFILILILLSFLLYFQFNKPEKISNFYSISRNKTFIRHRELKEISDIFLRKSHDKDNKLLVINGFGGSGKTVLARRYGLENNSSVAWSLNAQTEETLLNSFEVLAAVLADIDSTNRDNYNSISLGGNSNQRNIRLINYIKSALRRQENWILIYDNLGKEFKNIGDYLLINTNRCGKGKNIVTTREEKIDIGIPYALKTLGSLSKKEKIKFFNQLTQIHNSNDFSNKSVEVFLEKIPPYPLDISIVSHHLKLSKNNNLINLLTQENLENVQKNLLEKIGKFDLKRSKIINVVLNKICNLNPSYYEILHFISLIDHKDIPRDLLNKHFRKKLVDQLIKVLVKYSFLTNLSNSVYGETFSVHESIHSSIYEYFKNKEKNINKFYNIIIDSLKYSVSISLDVEGRKKIKPFLYHTSIYLKKNGDSIQDKNLAKLKMYLGKVYSRTGMFNEALPLLKSSIETLKAENNFSFLLVKALQFLAASQIFLGQIYEGQRNLHEAIRIFEKMDYPYDKDYGLSLTRLGFTYLYFGKINKSKYYIKKGISVGEKINNPHVKAFGEGFMGLLLNEIGNYSQAELYLKNALRFYKKSGYKIGIGWILAHLGYNSLFRKKFREAVNYLGKSHVIFLEGFGPHYVNTGLSASLLGLSYLFTNNIEDAYSKIIMGYKIYKEHYGVNHSQTAIIMQYLGIYQLSIGNIEEGKKLIRQAHEIFQNTRMTKGKLSLSQIRDFLPNNII